MVKVLRFFSVVIGITTGNVFGLLAVQIPGKLANMVYDSNIRSVQLHASGWEFSMPVIELGSDQRLELRFDDLSGNIRSFEYKLIHCDMQWNRSQLSETEYITGYGNSIIDNYKQSLNTTWFYVNYTLVFPEENMVPSVSGNYAIVVHEEGDPEKVILIRRFYITENTMNIEAAVRQPLFGVERTTSQQLLFTVNYHSSEIRDPLSELATIALQNYRYDNQMIFQKPYLSKPGSLEFTDPNGGLFAGGNEFRTLDIKSMRYQTENIAQIDFRNPYFHVVLKPDAIRSNKPWFSKADLNGSYYIDRERSADRHTESDYVYVHFNLELPPVYSADEVYVAGAFTNWEANAGYRLKFNPETGLFEITLLLKQGLYDYCFLLRNAAAGTTDEYEIEGSFYETENDYSFFVYFHDPFKRYDRLTGHLTIK